MELTDARIDSVPYRSVEGLTFCSQECCCSKVLSSDSSSDSATAEKQWLQLEMMTSSLSKKRLV
jgi:hypothetical protein